MGYRDEGLVIDLTEKDDKSLDVREGDQICTYYPSYRLPFVLTELEVNEYIAEPKDGDDTPRQARIIRGKAAFRQRTLSLIGDAEKKTASVDVSIRGYDGPFKQANEDPNSLLGTLTGSGAVGAAQLGFIHADWELDTPDMWYLELAIPHESFESWAQNIIEGRVQRCEGSAYLRDLYSREHHLAPDIGPRDLFLRPSRSDNSTKWPETAFGALRVLTMTLGRYVAPVEREEDLLDEPTVSEPREASGDHLQPLMALIAKSTNDLRTTMKWTCGFIVAALLFSAR